ncbi:MAG TPA: hypothetical protein VGH03_10770 [Caulobacteraceae bacterium]|jgi:hypothetical protein
MLVTLFRGALALQVIVVFAQALLAGVALSGDAFALGAHRVCGAASLIVAVVQVAAAILLVGLARAPRWLVPVNIGFLIAEGLQMAAGRLGLLGIHLPLGVALFGAAVAQAVYAATSLQPAPGRQIPHRAAQVAQRGG